MEFLRELVIEKAGLTEEHYSQFCWLLKPVYLKKKEFLIQPGAVCSFIGFVETGVLRSFIQRKTEEFNLDFSLPCSVVSAYTSFLTQTLCNGFIQALANTQLHVITYADYQNLLSRDAAWFKLGKYISDALFIKKCNREASLLMDSASNRYEALLKNYPGIEQLVSQYHLAAYLGIQPESLSRMKALTYIKE